MNARTNILARLRAAPAGVPVPAPDVAAWHAAAGDMDSATRIERFRANIAAAHAEVHDTDIDSWPALLCGIAAQKGVRKLLVGKDAPEAAALAARAGGDLQLVRYEKPASEWRSEFFDDIDAALTPARSALADTGSLILWPDARAPRLMSLVPPLHFVLLDAASIHTDLYAAMTAERWADAMPTNALVISGPSKTADIQQTLAYGAHGPREVIVLLIGGAQA
ncbi:MAG: lactate utilization protein [Rhodocyclaceae bacterium]|nr:lactate utilization protein [Rhodocyclaceae bacterium]